MFGGDVAALDHPVSTRWRGGSARSSLSQRIATSKTETPQQSARRNKIVELKKKNPHFGVRRISDVLKRMFWIPASPGTVHKTLQEEQLIDPTKKKRAKKNPAKPRFFERGTPNQLWQSDIMSFRLGGKAVYLIGYIDDYSRYIVGLGLYRSQTGEAVLETTSKFQHVTGLFRKSGSGRCRFV